MDNVVIVIDQTISDVSIAVVETIEQVVMTAQPNIGERGYSAYQLAVLNGFVGTEIEYLDSLKSDITISTTAPPTPYLNQLWIKI